MAGFKVYHFKLRIYAQGQILTMAHLGPPAPYSHPA